jgi:hypothetical protein
METVIPADHCVWCSFMHFDVSGIMSIADDPDQQIYRPGEMDIAGILDESCGFGGRTNAAAAWHRC